MKIILQHRLFLTLVVERFYREADYQIATSILFEYTFLW